MIHFHRLFLLLICLSILACQPKDLQDLSVEELDTHIDKVTLLLDSLQTIRSKKIELDTTGKYGLHTVADIESIFENRRVVTIKGKIDTSFLMESLNVIKDRPYQTDFRQVITVDDDGSFSDEFEIETNGLFEFTFKDHSYDIYLENGKTIGVIVDTLLPNRIRFIGDLSEENNYLNSSIRHIGEIGDSEAGLQDYSANEYAAFIQQAADTLHQDLVNVQKESRSAFSKDFVRLIEQQLQLNQSRALLDYAVNKKDTLPEAYFAAKEIDLNNDDLYHLFEFRKYLFEYFEYTADKMLQDSALTDKTQLNYFEAKYNLADQLFTNQTITEFLKTDVIFDAIAKMRHIGINSLVSQFQSEVTNQSFLQTINNRYKSMIKANNGTLASELTGVTIEGEEFSLSELRGKYVYIFVWATWCGPCKVEIPFYKQMIEDYSEENIEFVGISVDRDKGKWKESFLYNEYPGLQVLIPGDWKSPLVRDYNIASIPQFILIDPKGEIAALHAESPTKQIKAQLSQYGMFAKVY